MDRGRRRIDRITDPSFVAGLDQRPVGDLRRMRDESRAEETRLSYNRRLLQGRIDIARAEQHRREAGLETDLIDLLPSILADAPTPRAVATTHTAPVWAPTGEGGRRTDDQLLADASLGQVPDLSDTELAALVERLAGEEHKVSEVRATVLRHHDVLQEELVRRYRNEGVASSDIVGRPADEHGPSPAGA